MQARGCGANETPWCTGGALKRMYNLVLLLLHTGYVWEWNWNTCPVSAISIFPCRHTGKKFKKKKKGQKSYKVWESICILKDLVNPTVLRSEEFQKWFNLILQVAALCWAQNLHCSENSDADLFFYFFHSEVAHSGNREQRTDGAYPGNDSYRWNIRGRKNIRSICIKYVSIDVPWIAQTVSSILSN